MNGIVTGRDPKVDARINSATMLTDPHLTALVDLLKQYDPEKIILFGSRARNEADNFSDYDIVVIKKTDRPFLDRMQDMVPYLVQFQNLPTSWFTPQKNSIA